MSSSQSSRSRSREASRKLIRLATADGSLETSAGSSLTLLPRVEESFEEWLKRQEQIGMKKVETLEKTKVMKDKKEIPKPKSPKQSFEECLKRRKHKWTKISSSSSQSSRSRSREASRKLIGLATADGSLETSAGSSLTLLPRAEESFEEWLKRQKQIGMKKVETLEKTKVMKDKKEIPKPKSPKQSFEECLKRRKHKWTKISSSSSSSASSSQSSRSRSREARRLAAAKRCANRLKRKQKNDAKKLKDAAERESKENLKRISRIAELEETLRKQEIDTISRIAELEETIRKQENDAKTLKDAAERESKENLKRNCRIAELEETLRKLQASFKGTLQALEEKRAQLSEENMRLKTDLEMKKHISTFVVSGACWQYEMDGSWHALPPEGNEQMQKAYLAYLQDLPNSRHATISSGGVARVVDFDLMKQRHFATQKVRSIRILPNVPAQWVSTPAELLQQGDDLRSFYKEVADKEILDSIHRILQETGHAQDTSGHWGPNSCSCMRAAKVKSVHRIENYRLWHRYRSRIGAMRQDNAAKKVVIESAPLDLDGSKRIMEEAQAVFHCGEVLDPDVDEKILLHGTSWENANSIVREGFDHRTCQNAFYGAGVYFAGAACKSHQYTCENHKPFCCNCGCERTLIISRVALGDSYLATETRKKERRPPLRRESSGTYDSIMVKPGAIQGHPKTKQIHQEFVIFDREQAYPCYVVQYEL